MKRLLSVLSIRWTIARRIALAFVSMCCITLTLAGATLLSVRRAGDLVAKTFDESVVSINFARAAADDFSRMRSSFAQSGRARSGPVTVLERSLRYDLGTAIDKLPTTEMAASGRALLTAEALWMQKATELESKAGGTLKDRDELNRIGTDIDQKIEAMVDIVGDAAYAYRQSAAAMVRHDEIAALVSSASAIAILAIAAFMLYRGITLPLKSAVAFANQIAEGALDGVEPRPTDDEIGTLLRAMRSMRSDIKSMMRDQVVLRESSQARVSEALESSQEGIVVSDGRGIIQIANARALDFLGLKDHALPPGTSLSTVRTLVGLRNRSQQALIETIEAESGSERSETVLPDGRRIQISRSRTSEGGFVGLYADISTLADQKANLDAALANMTQGLCVFDMHNRLKLANRHFFSIFGIDPASAPVDTPLDVLIDMSLARGNHLETDAARLRREVAVLVGRRRKVHRLVPFATNRNLAVTHEPMPDGGWLATFEDVTERRQAEDRIAYLANHDALTGLPNRMMLAKRVEDAINRVRTGAGFAMLSIDLDRFKEVNDTLGHAVGDALLKGVAGRLAGCIRKNGMVARLGGDEFAVLQGNVANPDDTETLARRIMEALRAPCQVDGHTISVQASIGIALAPQDGLSYGDLLRNADVALHKSKEDGRGSWTFFAPAMDEKLKARRRLESDLKTALLRQEFEVHYQPLLRLDNLGICAFEALVRWRHPVRGLVMPTDFISAAEEMGLVESIGASVLRQACLQAVTWPGDIGVAVNVSIVQLRDPGFADTVRAALGEAGLAPDRLELEVTESVFMSNNTNALATLQVLKSYGIRFSIDDFGTGYSSLSYLRRFAFDKIKIDRSFLKNMMENEEAEQIVRTIIGLGRNLGMTVIAEGVETPKQMSRLQQLGCDEIQGYLIGKPSPATTIPDLLEQHNGPDGTGRRAA